MSNLFKLNQFKQLDSLESQIDRLNSRISQFVNTSICSESESEDYSHRKGQISYDLPSPIKTPTLTTYENPQLFTSFCQVSMKLEDLRSSYLQENQQNSSQSVHVSKKVDINELYLLYKQVKNVIVSAENEEKIGKIEFLGVNFEFQVIGTQFPNKHKLVKPFFQTTVSTLEPNQSIPNEVLSKFCNSFEDSMKNRYFDHLFTGEFKSSRSIIEKQVFNYKSWSLLQANYTKLKNYNENCEKITNTLEWQKAEIQVIKAELQNKLQVTLQKEGELIFRQTELDKHENEFQEALKSFEIKQQQLLTEQIALDNYKKKLDKMKVVIKTQLEELNKGNVLNSSQKATNCNSRVTESSPSFKRLQSGSSAESEDTQTEVQPGENLSIDRLGVNFSFDRQNPKKFTLPVQKTGFFTPRSVKPEIFLTIPTTPSEKPPIGRPTKSPADSSFSQSEYLALREERLAERESELEKREKEIQKNWLKNPTAQEFIPMIQSEMVRLKTLQREYDKKVKVLQDRINKSENFEERFSSRYSRDNQSARDGSRDQSLVISDEESLIISTRVEKLKDLYTMMEELV